MTICYFSAAGNCLYVAKRIGGTLIPMENEKSTVRFPDENISLKDIIEANE